MSAAEKLKALEHALKPENYRYPDGIAATQRCMNALPQIVAVVEAAESVTFYGQEAHRYNEWHGSQIVLALAALDEVLS